MVVVVGSSSFTTFCRILVSVTVLYDHVIQVCNWPFFFRSSFIASYFILFYFSNSCYSPQPFVCVWWGSSLLNSLNDICSHNMSKSVWLILIYSLIDTSLSPAAFSSIHLHLPFHANFFNTPHQLPLHPLNHVYLIFSPSRQRKKQAKNKIQTQSVLHLQFGLCYANN